MNFFGIILISLGVAMDAFAVSIMQGICLKEAKLREALIIGLFFGGFQFLMPLLGQALGEYFHELVASIDHWVAFFILVGIGGKMLYESFNHEESEKNKCRKVLNFRRLFLLAIATSLDSLVVGIMLVFVQLPKWITICAIGLVTFALSLLGVLLGKKFNSPLLSLRAEIAGGIILIGMGFKILIQHIYF